MDVMVRDEIVERVTDDARRRIAEWQDVLRFPFTDDFGVIRHEYRVAWEDAWERFRLHVDERRAIGL